jgi:hypothetical protein
VYPPFGEDGMERGGEVIPFFNSIVTVSFAHFIKNLTPACQPAILVKGLPEPKAFREELSATSRVVCMRRWAMLT